MLVTLLGIVIDDKLMQYKNASVPMLTTLFGIVIDDKFMQYANA